MVDEGSDERRALRRVRLGAAVIGVLAALCAPVAARAGACAPGDGAPAIVAAVTGAALLRLETGETVVLSGLQAPASSSVPDETWPPREATRLELNRLVTGKAVIVSSAGRRIDRYGNIVGHVFVAGDTGTERNWLQGELIADGLARAAPLDGTDACLDDMLALEAAARADKRGHWGTSIFSDRDAGDLYGLRRLHDTFQSVTGILARVDGARATQALVLIGDKPASHDDGDGFRVELARKAGTGRRQSHFTRFEGMAGTRARVRGWIEGRRRAYMVVADPRLIEIISEPPPK